MACGCGSCASCRRAKTSSKKSAAFFVKNDKTGRVMKEFSTRSSAQSYLRGLNNPSIHSITQFSQSKLSTSKPRRRKRSTSWSVGSATRKYSSNMWRFSSRRLSNVLSDPSMSRKQKRLAGKILSTRRS